MIGPDGGDWGNGPGRPCANAGSAEIHTNRNGNKWREIVAARIGYLDAVPIHFVVHPITEAQAVGGLVLPLRVANEIRLARGSIYTFAIRSAF